MNFDPKNIRPGDVFQITNVETVSNGWIGAFVMAETVSNWGIQGFVHGIKNRDISERLYIRLNWNEIELIGHATLVPSDL